MEELHRQPEQYTEIVRADDPATLADFVEINVPGLIDNFGKLAIGNFLHHTTIKEKVFRLRKWCLVDFSGQINHLLLADRPCLLGGNLDDPDLWIALPIGPRSVFIATKRDRIVEIIIQQSKKHFLAFINERSLAQAQKYIWALDNSPMRFILNRLRRRSATARVESSTRLPHSAK